LLDVCLKHQNFNSRKGSDEYLPTSSNFLAPEARHIKALADEYKSRWPVHHTERRQIGREAEFPIIDQSGKCGDARLVLQKLLELNEDLEPVYEFFVDGCQYLSKLKGERLEFCLEVGIGTLELITAPCLDLHQICTLHENGLAMLRRACKTLGYRVLGYGVQPVSPDSHELMTPKIRYHKLVDVLGEQWYSFVPTASDQAHIDVDQSEMVQILNICSLLTPVVISLTANSSVLAETKTQWMSSREGMMGCIDREHTRHGMPTSLYIDLEDWIKQICQLDYLIKIDKNSGAVSAPQSLSASQKAPFIDFLVSDNANFSDFEAHEHYVWHSVRPRFTYGTLELRASCQQPHTEHMGAVALSLGIVEAAKEIERWLLEQAPLECWLQVLRKYHPQAVAAGLGFQEEQESEGNSPLQIDFFAFTEEILCFVDQALEQRGLGEQVYLQPIWKRFQERKCPAQIAVDILQNDGLPALLDHLAL